MKYCFLVILFSIIPIITVAQTDLSRFSVDVGITRNYQSDFGNNRFYAFSPELKAGGTFISDQFEWDAGLTYWWDGVRKEFDITDSPTYSFSSLSLGWRLNYLPEHRIIPFHFISGVSTRLVRKKYVGGGQYDGSYQNDNLFMLYTLDFGAGVDMKVSDTIRIRFDGLLFMPFVKKDYLATEGWGRSLKIGIDYYFLKKD